MILQIALTVAILSFVGGLFSALAFGSPSLNIHTRGEYIGGALLLLSAPAALVAVIAAIWGV